MGLCKSWLMPRASTGTGAGTGTGIGTALCGVVWCVVLAKLSGSPQWKRAILHCLSLKHSQTQSQCQL